MKKIVLASLVLVGVAGLPAPVLAAEQKEVVERSRGLVPAPPWPQGDQIGMANALGRGTWLRCAYHLSDPRARVYEVSHVRSDTMPASPFGVPLDYEFRPTSGIPGTRHGFNGESLKKGEPGAQGTQMDALGHFAYLPQAWDGQGEYPADEARYYGGYSQAEVKPAPDSPLLKLGIEHVPPVVTTAVLLDARRHLGGGRPLAAGQLVTAQDIEAMIEAQGLGWRGLLAGDVLYIYTGWEDHWRDPDSAGVYYTKGPGLSHDAAQYIEDKAVVLVALDNPFTDPAPEGKIRGQAPLSAGVAPDLPWVIHHHNLTQSGVHQIQNARLAEMAADEIWTSCTIVLPLRVRGASGSPVRPVAIGAPQR